MQKALLKKQRFFVSVDRGSRFYHACLKNFFRQAWILCRFVFTIVNQHIFNTRQQAADSTVRQGAATA